MKAFIKLHGRTALAFAGAFCGITWSATAGQTNSYSQTNLVSDLAGAARFTDTNLVNSWGLFLGSDGVAIAVDNGTGLATFYNRAGHLPISIVIPPPAGMTGVSAPTDLALNPFEKSFTIATTRLTPPPPVRGNNGGRHDGHGGGDGHGGDGRGNGDGDQGDDGGGDGRGDGHQGQADQSVLLFVTENGTIAGWGPQLGSSNAMLVVDNSASGAVYKGVALASSRGGPRLFVTDFNHGVVAVYDDHFKLLKTFTDTSLPAGFAPFGIRNIGGRLFVTFAQQDQDQHDDVPAPGLGFVDAFDTDGTLLRRVASQGSLNAPWGLTLAPRNFGAFGGSLLVGNFGDGSISAFDSRTGTFLGQLEDSQGTVIQIDGLWGLTFGEEDDLPSLYFTAGPNDEHDGLLGILRPVQHLKNHREAGQRATKISHLATD